MTLACIQKTLHFESKKDPTSFPALALSLSLFSHRLYTMSSSSNQATRQRRIAVLGARAVGK